VFVSLPKMVSVFDYVKIWFRQLDSGQEGHPKKVMDLLYILKLLVVKVNLVRKFFFVACVTTWFFSVH
jgi:hypothetical protein